MGEQALSQVGFVDQSACALRQRTVGAVALNPGDAHRGCDIVSWWIKVDAGDWCGDQPPVAL